MPQIGEPPPLTDNVLIPAFGLLPIKLLGTLVYKSFVDVSFHYFGQEEMGIVGQK